MSLITWSSTDKSSSITFPVPQGYLPYDIENANWFIKNKYLIQDNDKIKKSLDSGLVEIGNVPVALDMFEQHGTEELSDIIGIVDKVVEMFYQEDLDEGKLYNYTIVGYDRLEVHSI